MCVPSVATAQSAGETVKQSAEQYSQSGGSSDMDSEMGMMDDEMSMEMEMGMGYDEYGSDYGDSGYGGGGSQGSTSDITDTYASSVISLVNSFELAPLFQPAAGVQVITGPLLQRESDMAFAAGYQGMAVELMCGHMVTEYEEAGLALSTVKFSPALRRPVWNVRWAVSIAVRGTEDVPDASPIRAGTTKPGRRLASSGGYDDMSGGYSGEDMSMEMGMEEMGGGYSGEDMESMSGMGGMGRRPNAKPAAPTYAERNMLSDEAESMMDSNLGLVAEVVAEEFGKRFKAGDYGPLFTGLTPPEKIDPRAPRRPPPPRQEGDAAVDAAPLPTMSAKLDAALTEAPRPPGMWRPGITYLGQGASNEMLPVAQSEGIDFLFHFDVLLKPGRNNATQNVSRCRLFNVATGKQLALTKSMDSLEAAQKISTGSFADERAYVMDQLGSLLGIMDRDTKVVPMPQGLSPESVRRRISLVIGGPKARTLQTLAEIRLYQSLNLLTLDEVEMAFHIVGGSEGLLFLHGPREERLAMARTWAVRSQPAAPGE
ncbi:hypothetical protein [Rubripirellula lacrimiformis]|nr:hypothetical protein [Rubripirellula lacrimiformis]